MDIDTFVPVTLTDQLTNPLAKHNVVHDHTYVNSTINESFSSCKIGFINVNNL